LLRPTLRPTIQFRINTRSISDSFVLLLSLDYLRPEMFSKACEYAFRATAVIASASASGERLSLKAIAERTDAPRAFTAKILQELAKADIILSFKGPNGGFDLAPLQARKVKLSSIVEAIDGDAIFKGCAMGLRACNAKKPCPLHDQFAKIRDDLYRTLENTTIHDLSQGLMDGTTYLKR